MAERLTKRERREETARKLAEMRAAQARKERRAKLIVALSAVMAVVLVVAILVVVAVTKKDKTTPSAASGVASTATVNGVTKVPATVFDAVGAGTVQSVPAAMTGAEAITADNKPRVLYVGAEYCPYCAAERWAVVAALSRFGTFSNLGQTTSSSKDVDPSTATLSFHGATYTSDVLSFTGYETTTNQTNSDGSHPPLDTLTAADQALEQKYNAAPYVDSQSAGSIPFVDIGGKYVISGASYDPALLKGKTHEQIAAALSDPSSAIAKAVDGTANVITASLCSLTGGKPAAVCTSKGVVAGLNKLNGG